MNATPIIHGVDSTTMTALPIAALITGGGTTGAIGVQVMGTSGGAASPVSLGGAADMSPTASTRALLTAPPGQWSVTDAPAAATAAVAVAGALPGVRHVCTSIHFTLLNDGTAQTAPVTVVLRDGASGVGPILWSASLRGGANANGVVSITGLAIVGSFGVDMTLETTTAPDAAHFATVAMTGFDAA